MIHELDDHALFLLGALAEKAKDGVLQLKRLPRLYSQAQLLHLMHVGYLILIHRHDADDECLITEEGRKAWEAYRIDSSRRMGRAPAEVTGNHSDDAVCIGGTGRAISRRL